MIQECQLLIFDVLRIEVGKKDYLPRYVAEAIEREYAKKVELEKLYAESKISYEELHLQKVKVNSIYGATVKKIKDFKDSCKDPFLTPQWGVATSAFARKNLLKVASKVSNWLYSATDSIYCEDCEENAVIVDNFNDKCRTKIKDYCIKNCLDYDIFRDLGTYQAKEVIKKFYCLGKGTYMYTTVSGVFKITACGITTEYGEEAYHLKKLKAGKKVRLMYNHDITRCVIDGVEFISNGSSYDDYVDGDSIEFLSAMYYTVLINRRYI